MLVFGATVASAQSQQPSVAALLPTLAQDASVIGPGASGDHSRHFAPTPSDLQPLHELNRLLAFQVASAPLGPGTLAASRPTAVEGDRVPAAGGWSESIRTVGRGYIALALAYQATTFDSVDGIDLRSSEINLFIPHSVGTGDVSDRDIMQQTISLRLNRKVSLFALTYGWENRFDVGVTVPFVQVAADARITSRIIRTGSSRNPAVHEYDTISLANRTLPRYCSELEVGLDLDALQCHGSRTARGFGDIALRAKYRLFGDTGGLALGTEVRLPTGSVDNLIGLGAFQVRPSVLWSGSFGRVAPRIRADYAWSEGELSGDLGGGINRDVPDEIGLALGFDTTLTSRWTLTVDVAARRFDDVNELVRQAIVFPGRGYGQPAADFVGDDALHVSSARSLTQVSTAFGVHAKIPGSLLAQMSVLVPVSTDGLRPGPAAMFSITRSY